MPVSFVKRKLRSLRRNVGDTITYLALALSGNEIEKITDFNHCAKPVLLIHGFGATRRVFHILEERLRHDGYSLFTIDLGGIFGSFNTRSIENSAEIIAEKINKLYQKYKIKEKLAIIGHSKGGLIGRYYVKNYQGSKYCNCLITLGTPHRGTHWAMLGYFTPLGLITDSIQQMTPMSSLIKELNETSWPAGVKIYSIYSKDDRFVLYPSAILETESNPNIVNIEVPGQGHAHFLISKKSYIQIRKALETKVKKLPSSRSPKYSRVQKRK